MPLNQPALQSSVVFSEICAQSGHGQLSDKGMQVLSSDWQHLVPSLHIPWHVATVSVGSTRHPSAVGRHRAYCKLELSNKLVSQQE